MLRLITAGLIVFVTIPAYAQGMPGGMGGGGGRHHSQEQKAEEPKKKPDDKGYNSSLAKIPDRKYDPWQNIR
jgi:hypothetical protein